MKRDITKENKVMKNIHSGHRRRLMAKVFNSEYDLLEEHEILESMLFSVITRANTNPIAHNLIKRFGSLAAVIDEPYDELLEVDGVGTKVADFLYLISNFSKLYSTSKANSTKKITNFHDIQTQYSEYMKSKKNETFIAIGLDDLGNVMGKKEISKGDMLSVNIDFAKFQSFVTSTMPKNILIMHNHPVGPPNPSLEDIASTKKLYAILSYLHIYMLDHVIFDSSGNAFSFAKNGLLLDMKKEFSSSTNIEVPTTKLSKFKLMDSIK